MYNCSRSPESVKVCWTASNGRFFCFAPTSIRRKCWKSSFSGGHTVDTVHHELVASLKIASRHYYAVVADFCDERSVDEALRFCEQVKSLRKDQCFLLRAGHWQYVPENACPDAAVSKDDGPAALLQELEKLAA